MCHGVSGAGTCPPDDNIKKKEMSSCSRLMLDSPTVCLSELDARGLGREWSDTTADIRTDHLNPSGLRMPKQISLT